MYEFHYVHILLCSVAEIISVRLVVVDSVEVVGLVRL